MNKYAQVYLESLNKAGADKVTVLNGILKALNNPNYISKMTGKSTDVLGGAFNKALSRVGESDLGSDLSALMSQHHSAVQGQDSISRMLSASTDLNSVLGSAPVLGKLHDKQQDAYLTHLLKKIYR
jgi:hypothetical protein